MGASKRKSPEDGENEQLLENAPQLPPQEVVLLGGISTTVRRLQALRKPFKVRRMRGTGTMRDSLNAHPPPAAAPRAGAFPPPSTTPSCAHCALPQPPMASRPEANGRGVQVGIKFAKLAMLGPCGVLQQVRSRWKQGKAAAGQAYAHMDLLTLGRLCNALSQHVVRPPRAGHHPGQD